MPRRLRFLDFFETQAIVQTFKDKIAKRSVRGTDGTSLDSFTEKLDYNVEIIRRKVRANKYLFSRYKEKLISKGAGVPPREICIPTIRDRIALRCLLYYLVELFPEARSIRPHHYIKQLKDRLRLAGEDDCFVRVDIKEFYPSIDHRKMLATLRTKIHNKQALSLIKSAITTSCRPKESRPIGIPQGLSVSNHLSNLFLADIDVQCEQEFGAKNYFRYVDDILIISPKATANERFTRIEKILKKQKLSVHRLSAIKGKSLIKPVSEGIEYLGFHVSLDRISVRRSSLRRMYEAISAVITSVKYNKKIGRMCFKLDVKITGCILEGKRFGWLHFFQQTEDISQLAKLDVFISRLLARVPNLPQEYVPKRFVKAYHEIRYKADTTNYVPNFDSNSKEERVRILTQLAPTRYQNIDTETDEEINRKFFYEISKITVELERDLQEPTS